MLLAAGAFAKARTPDCWEAVHSAALTGNPDLVRTAVVAFLKETDDAFQRRLPKIQEALEGMPDFVLECKWEFTSWVPLLTGLLPNDTYRIAKRGSSLRLDSTLLGMKGLSWERGNLSLLLWGKEFPTPGSVRVLDWDNCTECDARLALTHPKDTQVQDWVRKLLTTKQKTTDWWSRDTIMSPMRHPARGLLMGVLLGGAGGGGGQVMEDVGGWGDCSVYMLEGLRVKDVVRTPILRKLKLEDWWRKEYTLETTVEAAAAESASAAAATAEAEAAGEAALAPLLRALAAIRSGKLNASSTSVKELEGMCFGGEEVVGTANSADSTIYSPKNTSHNKPSSASATHLKIRTFEEYFKQLRPHAINTDGAQGTGGAAAVPYSGSHSSPIPHYTHPEDGKLHRPFGVLAEPREGSISMDEKKLDLKVFFSKKFPITVRSQSASL